MTKKDPWKVEPNDVEKLAQESKGRSKGVVCLERNASFKKPCPVCNALRPLWNFPDGSSERKIALTKKATINWYLNVVLPFNKDKSVVMEVGKKLGDSIIEGIKDPEKDWSDISNPKAGKGLLMKIKKKKGDLGFNAYEIFPATERADWDIPESVLNNLIDLSQENLVKMLNNEELTSENYLNISTLKLDETIVVRICPNWDWNSGGKWPLNYLYRHWGGVTQEEMDGKVPVDLRMPDKQKAVSQSDDTPFDMSSDNTPEPVVQDESDEVCLGRADLFEDDDDSCTSCRQYKQCKKLVMKKGGGK